MELCIKIFMGLEFKGDKDEKCNIYMYNHFNLDLIRNFFVHP